MLRRIFFLFSFLTLATLPVLAQEMRLRSHIADADTKEALPYVSVYVSERSTTVANHEGDFTIAARPGQKVRLSYVGYNAREIPVENFPDTIYMKVATRTLQQLTVMPYDDMLHAVVKQLNKEYIRKSTKKGQYFCRLTSRLQDKDELTEAFLEAETAINLRNMTMLNGRRGQMTRWGLIRPTLSNINLHHTLDLGPMVQESPFWAGSILPLSKNASKGYFTKHFNITCEVLEDSIEGKVYCFTMEKKEKNAKDKGSKATSAKGTNMGQENPEEISALVGKIYVKASTNQLLRFDGEVTGMTLEVVKNNNRISKPATMKIRINYTLRNGFTEVDDISCEVDAGEELNTQTIMHNVSDLKIEFPKKKNEVRENMISAVDAAGFDSTLWKYSGIIQRTTYEEQLAQEQATIDSTAITQHIGDEQLDKLIDRARLFGQRIPQEKVFLHLDNTNYFLGDTIWYAAYTRQTNNDHPSSISNVLYVELLNNDGYVMERQVVKMHGGRGHGNIYLDPEYYAGFYELRAYTRWQLNWGAYELEHGPASKKWFVSKEKEKEFFRDYDKLYSRVVPVYDAPLDSASFDHDMTLRPMRRQFRKETDPRKLVVTLFPEGGNLVYGAPCHVAFEAAWDDGEWVDGTLMVDSTAYQTVHRGRGAFTVTPQKGKRLPKTVFSLADGTSVTAKWPDVEEKGVALSVIQEEAKWIISVTDIQGIEPDSLAMTIMHEGVLTHVIPLNKGKRSQEYYDNQLEPGVQQVTVFDTRGRIWADRLFFVSHSTQNRPNITISGLKDEYRPYEKIALDIQAIDPEMAAQSPISLSVRDTWNGDYLYDTGNMLTEMLLSSEVKGFIPQPEWYFESNDSLHRQALDLLMMTQGWRRFSWKDMAVQGAWDLTHPDEKNIVVEGLVLPYVGDEEIRLHLESLLETDEGNTMSGLTRIEMAETLGKRDNKEKELTVHAEIVEGSTLQATSSEIMTQNRRFRLKLPDFYDKSIFFLSAADLSKLKPGKNYTWIQQSGITEWKANVKNSQRFDVDDPEYMVYISQPWPRYATPFNWYQNHLAPAPAKERKSFTRRFSDGATQLDEVSVQAKRSRMRRFSDAEPAFIVDAYDAWNNAMDAGFRPDPEFIVRSYIGDLGLADPYVLESYISEEGDIETLRSSRIGLRFGPNPLRLAFEKGIDSDSLKNMPDASNTSKESLFSLGGQESTMLAEKQDLMSKGYLWSMDRKLDPGERKYYFKVDRYDQPTTEIDMHKMENFVIYTDYAPRHRGENRYVGSNLPETYLALYPYADAGMRNFYRDRRYIIQGFSIADDFYHPDYSNRPLPKEGTVDRRRTLYWNPLLELDENGHASIILYNSCRNAEISVTAEGMTNEGTILTGKNE